MPNASTGRSSPGGNQPAASAQVKIPHLVSDPVASLKPWPLDVQVAYTQCRIPSMAAADWLSILMSADFEIWDIIPGQCPESTEAVEQALADGLISIADFRDICLEVITTVAGRPWWYAMRLIAVVQASWEVIGGNLIRQGALADQMPLGAWLDSALLTCLEHIPGDKATMFLSKLEVPPKDIGIEVEEPEMSRSEFLSLG